MKMNLYRIIIEVPPKVRERKESVSQRLNKINPLLLLEHQLRPAEYLLRLLDQEGPVECQNPWLNLTISTAIKPLSR